MVNTKLGCVTCPAHAGICSAFLCRQGQEVQLLAIWNVTPGSAGTWGYIVALLDLVDRMQHATKRGKLGVELLETFMEGADCADAERLKIFSLRLAHLLSTEHLMRIPEELTDPD
jgi:hypothetical protein